MTWETVIGLEIHAQLTTASKIFSPAAAAYCEHPNRQVREVDLGLPGALPTLNRRAVENAVRLSLALSSDIRPLSEFARKNYFYPDLPKGYQISQFEYPLARGGEIFIAVGGGDKRIGITRAHLEEDAGKLQHDDWAEYSGVDLNRAGVPLLEIVSEPDMRSPEEAAVYARAMHVLVKWLGVCDGNMQEGSFRIDANISLRRPGAPLGTRCEIKNLNSFRFLRQALEYEQSRQADVLQSGGEVAQETRLFDPASMTTRAMRGKEDAHDYRYFPDPDLPPLEISSQWLAQIARTMPELPRSKKRRLTEEHGLAAETVELLTAERAWCEYYEAAAAALCGGDITAAGAKLCANWICGEVAAMLNKRRQDIDHCPVSAKILAELLRRVTAGDISGTAAKTALEHIWDGGGGVEAAIEQLGLKQISDADSLRAIGEKIVAAHPSQAAQYRAGKDKLMGFFVGQIMKETQGRANPALAGDIMKKLLE